MCVHLRPSAGSLKGCKPNIRAGTPGYEGSSGGRPGEIAHCCICWGSRAAADVVCVAEGVPVQEVALVGSRRASAIRAQLDEAGFAAELARSLGAVVQDVTTEGRASTPHASAWLAVAVLAL